MKDGYLKEYLAEATGTFALVFAGTGAIVSNDVSSGAVTGVGVALVFGLVIMVMIYALGDISGAHLNPAVTIGFCIARNFPVRKASGYIIAQISGVLSASIILRLIFFHHPFLGATLPRYPVYQSVFLEFILTFMLMFVILNVTRGTKERGIVPGIAIGATVGLCSLFAGPISGASMNPARSLAPAIISGHLEYLWIYIIFPVFGVIFACFLSRFMEV